MENVDKGPVLKIKEYSYDTATEGQFKRKNELYTHYMDQRRQSFVGDQKQMKTLINQSKEKMSLMTVRDSTFCTLSLALTDENKVSELRIDMNHLLAPDKIWLHNILVKLYMQN